MNQRFYEKAIEWTRAGKRVAVASVVETVGSTPRKPGAKMLVSSEMELYGTIGGGCVEADVIFAAREVMKTLVPKLLRVDIKAKNAAEIDMLCGGEVTLYIEPVMPDFRLLICGGGHISKAIAHAAQGLDFHLTVVDDRPQFANDARFPGADVTVSAPYEELAQRVELTPTTFVVIVTRGHTGDEVCLRQVIVSPACYIAMVGSRSKWSHIRQHLLESGISRDKLNRVFSPAGLDIGSITPEEIAISIVAQIVQQRAELLQQGLAKPTSAKKQPAKRRKQAAE